MNIFVAEVETRSTQSHGYGASAEEAVAALLRCWQEQYAPSTRADPDYLTGMREEIAIYSVELGRGYVIGPHDNFARTFVARGDHGMFDPVFAGASARPSR